MESTPQPKKVRPGEVAAAIGSTYSAISRWISRYGDRGVKPKAEQTGGWMEFNFGDVAALALTKYLIDIGMPAPEAFERAMSTIQECYPNLFDDEPKWVCRENTGTVILGRDRTGHWITNDPHFKLPLRVIIHVETIIADAFWALREMGHVPPTADTTAQEEDSLRQQLARLPALREKLTNRKIQMAAFQEQMKAARTPDEILQLREKVQALDDDARTIDIELAAAEEALRIGQKKMSEDNVTRPMFGAASGFCFTPDNKCIVGLDEAETQEFLTLLRETPRGSNPHRNPRYRELYEKIDRALMAKLIAEISNTEE